MRVLAVAGHPGRVFHYFWDTSHGKRIRCATFDFVNYRRGTAARVSPLLALISKQYRFADGAIAILYEKVLATRSRMSFGWLRSHDAMGELSDEADRSHKTTGSCTSRS